MKLLSPKCRRFRRRLWGQASIGAGIFPDADWRETLHRPAFPKRVIRFSVEESWFGLAKDAKEIEVETGMGGGDCGFGFERGEKYLVYA